MQTSNLTPSSLKRPFAQTVSTPNQASDSPTPQSQRTGSPSGRGSFSTSSFRGHRANHSRNNSRSRLSGREKDRDTLEPPLWDENHIKQTYKDVKISTPIADNPKNSLANFATQILGAPLDFERREGIINKQKLWR